MPFSHLGVSEALNSAIKAMGHTAPTEIQEIAIPVLLGEDRDFGAQAQTGTGKTLSFAVPLLSKIQTDSTHIQGLVLTPTRELAKQVHKEVLKLSNGSGMRSLLVVGGDPISVQKRALRSNHPHIIIGTPGRVCDLLAQKVMNLRQLQTFVLDEGDEMLKMGFLEDIERILDQVGPERRFWLFSATLPAAIEKLVGQYCQNPKKIKLNPKVKSNVDIRHGLFVVKQKHHQLAFQRLIKTLPDFYGLVFCQTKVQVEQVCRDLQSDPSLSVRGLHGDMSWPRRQETMGQFREGKVKILVCTDIAARGLDVKELTHVINFGIPREIESYVHRTGRTGRGGSVGHAWSLVDPRDLNKVRMIEKSLSMIIERKKLPDLEQIKTHRVNSELANLMHTKAAVLGKGQTFKIDNSFQNFSEFFSDLDRDQLLKIFFSSKFNKEFRQYEALGNLDSQATSGPSSYHRAGSSGGGGRRKKRPGRSRARSWR